MTLVRRCGSQIAFSALLCCLFTPTEAFSASESPVASIGKQSVPMQELEARAAAKLSELQKSYDKTLRQVNVNYARDRQTISERELDSLLDERVLALEATATKSTPEALKSALKRPDVTDATIRAFFESNKNQMDQPFEKTAPLIKDYLEKQSKEAALRDYLSSLRTKYKVTVSLQPLREQVAVTGPQRGPDSAAITMVEFSDFQCPFCGRFSPVVKDMMARYPTQVRLVYRHLPLPSLHPHAQRAAKAAVCAQFQGKFWEMHDLLFSEQSALDDEALKEKATRIGLDTKSFDECMSGSKAREIVQQDVEAAEQLGISGTPFSFINGRFINGAVSADELKMIIDDELRRVAPEARR